MVFKIWKKNTWNAFMINKQSNKPLVFFLILAGALFLPAYLLNLNMVQLINDEAIRALVSFEMIKSGDFITPTIGGEPYLMKPPLFNWILAFFFQLTGSWSEIVIRLPVILSVIIFSATIYAFMHKEFGNRIALVNALAFITYGRIIFYESLHGLIDVTFSWLIYLFFMVSWHFFRKKKYLSLFLTAYAIASIAYLLKGLPSLFFVAVTLLVLFIQGKQFRMLFNWRHFVGIGLLLVIVGGYYLLYFMRNSIEPGQVFQVLTGEVTRRTVVRFGIWNTLLHLFTYPFENIYHFLPWSVLVILLFRKGSLKLIRQNKFLWYLLLVFTFNIIPYWTSPEAYARYILMLVPLLMTILFSLYFHYRETGARIYLLVDYLLGGFIGAISLAGIVFLLHPATRNLPYIAWVSALLFLALAVISYFYWKQSLNRLLWLAIAVLVIRIAFDYSIIPSWEKSHPVVATKKLALELAAETAGRPLYIYWNPRFKPDPYLRYRYNNEIFIYYLSAGRNKITMTSMDKIPGALYLAKTEHLQNSDYIIIKMMEPAWQDPVYLVEFK
jgi:4-amino-4-deoxy-L-arabinose transferase-like glycosyltransferase